MAEKVMKFVDFELEQVMQFGNFVIGFDRESTTFKVLKYHAPKIETDSGHYNFVAEFDTLEEALLNYDDKGCDDNA